MRLLIIGDLYGQIGAASSIAKSRGAKVAHVADIEAAMNALRAGQGADLVMIEVREDIEKLVTLLMRERFNLPVVACGVKSDKDAAVKAIKSGAKEYIPLPPDEELIAAVLEAIAEEAQSVIFASAAMAKAIALADQIAPSEASIMITGESGTGKEVIARYIHKKSKRASHPMISVNCAAIPENLLESELFGYEKGSFTGAVARRIGKFEEADGGTILLDEISEMDMRLQSKLLRVLQEREVDRIGGARPVKVNIRVLATSNRNLQDEVKKGGFREDLYFRLNVISLHMPSLRDRRDDIKPLAEYFILKYSKANGIPTRPLSNAALDKLTGHRWPGNVRELENAMHRTVLLATGKEIEPDAIALQGVEDRETWNAEREASTAATPRAASHDPRSTLVGRTVNSVEQELILDTLGHCLGNRTHAANILGISIRTLRNKIKSYSEQGVAVPPAPTGTE
ncbi:MAG: sigma-54-dependent Fis family transcriptional regulator [Pseudomonadota bacterium]|nr:sigma-54-dependent Fis family transcriptional regulator [Pseudomonadota bacterium]MDE3036874.1 sigma-54-dependent Fis family transcriptional regulator [Pseudomonadota bacterium]